MKKTVSAFMLSAMLLLTACGSGGNVDNVEILDWKPSEIYSDKDIEAAIKTVEDYFSKEFYGCTLTRLCYPGDTYADEFQECAQQYDGDEAIVLLSSFDVAASGAEPSLNPGATYTDWSWILIRDNGGSWKHVDHGY